MLLGRVDENDLLLPLHAGAHEAVPWVTFLDRLRRRARADVAALVLTASGEGAGKARLLFSRAAGASHAPPDLEAYACRHLRPGRVYDADEIDGEETDFVRIVRVDEPGGAFSAWMVVTREEEDFVAADGALLATLVPHLAVALQTMATLDRSRARSEAAGEALSRLGIGWMTLNDEARIVDIDPVAEAMLRDGIGMMRFAGERLHAGEEATRILAGSKRGAGDVPRLVTLSEMPRLHLLVQPVRRRSAEPGRAALIGFLRGLGPASGHRAAIAAALFGLSMSEARMAIALADGSSIADVAIALGLTIETARNYSKRLYAKTGARGQADLVRMVLGSVAALA